VSAEALADAPPDELNEIFDAYGVTEALGKVKIRAELKAIRGASGGETESPAALEPQQIAARAAMAMKVNVKWNKQKLDGLELDPTQPTLIFKSQLFSVTMVEPERQKIMIKASLFRTGPRGGLVEAVVGNEAAG
jgi:hypothetical protein